MTLKRNIFMVPVASLVLALGLSEVAAAQEHERARPSGSVAAGRAVPRAPMRSPAPSQAPRMESPRTRTLPAPRSAPQRVSPGRVAPNRSYLPSGAVPRYSVPGYQTPRYSTVPRYSTNGPRYVAPRYSSRYSSRYVAPRYVSPRYVTPYRYYQPYYYRAASPYYVFRPRLRVGFGIYIGYPVSFPSWYDPYVPGVYPYYRSGVSYGGISFDIQPYDALVYVDGNYAGVVNDFSPLQAPLTLPAGSHHIDIEADGLAPLSFDITVVPGQVIPYQGSLSQ